MNRNGSVDLSDPTEDEGEDTWSAERGAIFLANIDDDLGACAFSYDAEVVSDIALAQCHDAADDRVNGQEDLEDLARLLTVPWPDAPEEAEGRLTVSETAASKVRLFRKTEHGFELFDPSTARLEAQELRRGAELAIEARDIVRDLDIWDGYVDVVLSVSWKGGTDALYRDTVRLRVSPVMTFHHLNAVKTLYTAHLSIGTREDLVDFPRFQAELDRARAGVGVTEPLYLYDTGKTDRWVQDLFESGFMSMPAPGGQQHVIRVNYRSPFLARKVPTTEDPPPSTDSPLRPGSRLAFQLRGRDSAVVQQYDPNALTDAFTKQTLNALGNLETIPPYEKGGVHYPFGRLLMGSIASARVDPTFTRMLEAQRMQPPVYLDTSWLFVGHVDEILSFLPVDSPRGWVALVAAPELARTMLEDARAQGHGDAKLFTGKVWGISRGRASAEVSISQVLADVDVMNESAAAAVHVDAQLAILQEETGLTDAEIIRVPFLFQRVSAKAAAYQPGTVNLLSLSRNTVVAPDPHGPVVNGKDIFKAHLEAALEPYGITVFWLDDWLLYHRGNGNVHCATNATRQIPEVKWWQTGR
ncbi:protein-arginine deiminase domain-containing protein [Archangium lipolyticum]|uniref:protein-arginine deiminase domain-containing protein n=1 Tax=Archangium lipolyticum TaxID=2970465 RepID=UPI00214A11FC|nr:protein-arginine deiminase domain-containing protein [Archangium lipolyticum]